MASDSKSDSEEAEWPLELNVLDPKFLYGINKVLKITSHQPPQPFGDRGLIPPFDKHPRITSQDDLQARSTSDHVFTRHPMERQEGSQMPPGASQYFAQNDNATLVIAELLDVEDNIGAQVVLCKFKKESGEFLKPVAYWDKMGLDDRPIEVVAKIYDPLLYPKTSILAPGFRSDVVNVADAEYAREAAAHAELHEAAKTQPILHDFVPRFYGTWSTTIENEDDSWGCSDTRPDDNNSNGILPDRPVRIVLMEYIKGQTIWESCRRRYEDAFPVLVPSKKKGHDLEYRLNIFARILRGLVALEHVGVLPLELWATKLMITDAAGSDKRIQTLGKARVVLISYCRLRVTRYRSDGPHEDQNLPRPRHPSQSKYNPDELSCLAGWYPRDWLDDDQPFVDWVKKVFRKKDFAEVKLLPGITQPSSSKEVAPSLESAKQSSGSDKSPQKTSKGGLLLKDISSSSANESIAGSDVDLGSSMATLPTVASSLSSLPPMGGGSHATLTSAPSSLGIANEPTAKEAGRMAAASGIVPVPEIESGGEPGDEHDADDEGSPPNKSG
ncbi:hypothetical protein F5X68DRAFT_253762 [Plectosphaerella plurivora]|uniref:Uncharacterized protein n=1 Tax=Plectosphaerella plurivora TaxID=936078 RepID=A0A9P9ACD7_9PEZI|nr:hypothetical protein F5X68DRAFT_253762 [Plectosphaerella plurivora]